MGGVAVSLWILEYTPVAREPLSPAKGRGVLSRLNVLGAQPFLLLELRKLLALGTLNPASHPVFSLDSDDDGTLDKKDLENLVNSLTGEGEDSRLSPSEMEQLIQNVSAGAGTRQEGRPEGAQPILTNNAPFIWADLGGI